MLTIEQIKALNVGDKVTVDVTPANRKRKVFEQKVFIGFDNGGYLKLAASITNTRVISCYALNDASLSQ